MHFKANIQKILVYGQAKITCRFSQLKDPKVMILKTAQRGFFLLHVWQQAQFVINFTEGPSKEDVESHWKSNGKATEAQSQFSFTHDTSNLGETKGGSFHRKNKTYRKWLCNTHFHLLSFDFSFEIYWLLMT